MRDLADPPAPTERLPKRRLALMLCLGFASGLPLFLTFTTLQQWLTEAGLSLKAVGFASMIGLSYTLKFLWSPLLDRMPPGLLRHLGRRRGWMLLAQAGLTLSLAAVAAGDPHRAALHLVAAAVLVAFFSASQDVAIDAWRIETFPAALQAAALGGYLWGYRIAMLVSSGGALWLAGRIGWHGAYGTMALLSLIGPVAALLAPEPRRAPAVGTVAGWREGVSRALVAPLRDLLARPGAAWVLGFVLLFNLGTQFADTLAMPYYRALGFTRNTVAAMNSLPALGAALAGAAASGVLVARLGLGRALILCSLVQMASVLLYVALFYSHAAPAMLFAKVVLEGFAEVVASTTFLTYLSRLCAREFTATQYALLSSLTPIAWRTVAGTSGVLAGALGWVPYFSLCVLGCLPGILAMLVLLRRYPGGLPPREAT